MEDTKVQPISLTEGAVAELKKIFTEQNISEDHGLRIGVKGGGCSGLSYILGFDIKKDGDEEFDMDGLRIFMNRAHGMYLAGMEIDYLDNLENRGFIFNNPNAAETCGCGTSFSS